MKMKQFTRNPDLLTVPSGLLFPLAFEAEDTAEQYRAFIEKSGGFDPWNALLTPMAWSQDEDEDLVFCLSSIAGALEIGMVHKTEWPSQLFKSSEDLEQFLDALADYPERLRDRHFRAVAMLGGNWGACSNEESAEALRQALEELSAA
jgi:hypothetical protein